MLVHFHRCCFVIAQCRKCLTPICVGIFTVTTVSNPTFYCGQVVSTHSLSNHFSVYVPQRISISFCLPRHRNRRKMVSLKLEAWENRLPTIFITLLNIEKSVYPNLYVLFVAFKLSTSPWLGTIRWSLITSQMKHKITSKMPFLEKNMGSFC